VIIRFGELLERALNVVRHYAPDRAGQALRCPHREGGGGGQGAAVDLS
jgi:hypothetical protein